MLKGIDPLLTADLLYALRAAGHGDKIVVCDCNFPATTVAKETTLGKSILLGGATADQTVAAITEVLPLDCFEAVNVLWMSPDEGDLPKSGADGLEAGFTAIRERCPNTTRIGPCPRTEFYEVAKKSFVIVQACGERRPYNNYILTKGVIGPDGQDLIPG